MKDDSWKIGTRCKVLADRIDGPLGALYKGELVEVVNSSPKLFDEGFVTVSDVMSREYTVETRNLVIIGKDEKK